jgi:tetratricopeptide (TPR) repeat protein
MLTPFARLCLVCALACSSAPTARSPATSEPEPDPSLEAEAEPESGEFSAGVSAIRDGKFEAARAAFEHIVSAEPGNAQAHFYLGVAQQNLGHGAEAIETYEKAVSLDPKLTEAWVNLTAAKLDAGDAPGALPFIDRGLASHPDHPGLLYNRALALSAIAGRNAEAVAAYRKAAAADPGNAEIKYGYAETLLVAGSKDEALKLLRELGQSDKVEVLASAARLLGRLQAYDDCIRALGKALEVQKSSELYVERGLCQHGKKDDAAAFEDFKRAVQVDDSYAPAHYYVGMHLKMTGKKAQAKPELGRAVQLAGKEGVGKAAQRALDSI